MHDFIVPMRMLHDSAYAGEEGATINGDVDCNDAIDISDAIYYVGTGQLAKNLWKVNPKVYPRQLLM